MLKKATTFIAVLATCFLSVTSYSQVELKADGGSFEDVVPWGEGYLGIVQTQAYAVVPKFRQFQFFDNSGKLVWNQKITPFNFNNTSVCNVSADYAYFINMPFSKTAAMEKTSKTEFLNIYQVSRSGAVVEKSIPYTGVLQPLAGKIKDFTTCYIGAPKDGFVVVVSTDEKTYHVIRVDSQFNVSYQQQTFEWDEKLYEKGGVSKPKFVLNDTHFTMVQLKLEDSRIALNGKTYDLTGLSNGTAFSNSVGFEGYNLYSRNGYELEYSANERVELSYTREEWVGNNIRVYPTLGSYLEFDYAGDKLIAYGYFRNEISKGKVDNEGFVVYEPDVKNAAEIEPVHAFEFDNGSSQHAIHVDPKGGYIVVSIQKDKSVLLKTSEGGTKRYDEKVTMAQAFAAYINGSAPTNEEAEIDCVATNGKSYIGMDFEGMQNSFGNTKRVTIYKY